MIYEFRKKYLLSCGLLHRHIIPLLDHAAHCPLDSAWPYLVCLHDKAIARGRHYLAFPFEVAVESRTRNQVRRRTFADGPTQTPMHLPSHHVLREIRGDVSRTNREHIDAGVLQLDPGGLADRVQGELGGAVSRLVWHRNVPCDAGDVDDGPEPLL